MKRTGQLLARRYAQAIYEVMPSLIPDKLLVLADELEQRHSALVVAQELDYAESSPLLEGVFKQAGYGAAFDLLVKLLIEQRRVVLLPLILRALYDLCLQKQGIMHFTIESAVPLSDEEQQSLIIFLKNKTGKEIIYTLKNNPALIAGIKLYSNTYGYEHSIQQKLRQL